jgi:transcriptional regulator with XRE-family HTH domain
MLNEALRLIRVYHDLSQSDLSVELGISNSYLSELESGKKQPTLEMLSTYSSYFEIPMSSLMFFSEQIAARHPTEKLRQFAAGKVLSLLRWVEEKNLPMPRKSAGRKIA